MEDDDVKEFLEDFRKADVSKKMDMWFYAIDQQATWDEIMGEMSKIARINILKKHRSAKK